MVQSPSEIPGRRIMSGVGRHDCETIVKFSTHIQPVDAAFSREN